MSSYVTTLNDLRDHTSFYEKLRYYISIHRIFNQNRFINECVRKE